ncbi:DUF4232 domain-containing protein [Streptomyces sp. NPDC005775]|uniref:DUF4232 domain-containing protein n=1 Tax=unclassified Streptomyces TaxID=2593676 RepID=UPI0033D21C38
MKVRTTAFTGIRGPVSAAALVLAGTLGLSGCAGFLVPAGEGEPGPSPSRTSAGGVRATTPSPLDIATAPAVRPTPTPTPTPTATGGCPASGLVVDMGPVEAALGHRAVGLTLTNCGSEPHRVDGYPSVQALDENGDALPVKVNPGSSYFGNDKGPEEVMLAPGKTMRSLLVWVSTPTGGDLIEGDALEIAPAPGLEPRTFPLEGSDVRLLDEFNMTGWRTVMPE